MQYRTVFAPELFAGRHVVVTGGGSGIGRCTAHELAALGARVALVGRREEKLNAVCDEIRAADGPTPSAHACDIRDEARVRETVTRIIAEHGTMDGLVNNAGGQFHAPLEQISQKGWDTVVQNNLTGGFLMARECYTQAMKEHGGAIVNILADMWHGMPGMAHSGAARAGMLNLTETAAAEWQAAGVRVNAVAPGWIASSGMDTYPDEVKPMLKQLPRQVPLQRWGTESEVSSAIVFLLSEAAAFITGSCLRVDGGAPNARRHWPLTEHDRSPAYDGFHLSEKPRLLRDD